MDTDVCAVPDRYGDVEELDSDDEEDVKTEVTDMMEEDVRKVDVKKEEGGLEVQEGSCRA